jgi:transposase InsO family protein
MSFSYQEKLNIIQFYEKHGMEAALDYVRMQGVNLGQSTLYGWLAVRNKARCHSQSEFAALNPKSTKPYKQRTSNIPSVFIEFIKAYRKKRFGVGKEKLATIINQASSELSYAMNIKVEYGVNLYRLPKISSSSIGRIIDSLKKSGGIVRNAKEWNKQKLVYLDGRTGTVKRRKPIDRNSLYGKKKSRKPKDYKPSQVGDLIQLDAVTIQVPIMNSTTGVVATKKVYFVCGIDIVSRLAYSYCYSTLNSTSTTDFIQRFQLKLTKLTKQKVTIKNIQTDNGQENHKHFITHLNKQGINQFFNYPRSPKMNAFIEKYNHTMQCECIEYHTYLLRQGNQSQFNHNLEEWNDWYNHQRPHTSLQYLSPMQYFKQQLQS